MSSALQKQREHIKEVRGRLGCARPATPVVMIAMAPKTPAAPAVAMGRPPIKRFVCEIVYQQPIGPNVMSFYALAPDPFVTEETAHRLTWRQIAREVCGKHNLLFSEVVEPNRTKEVVNCRQEIMYRVRKETALSFKAIAERMGGVDHSTVMHSVRRYEQRMREAGQ